MKALIQKWMDKASKSLFFFIALLFHLILFLMVATWVIFQAPTPARVDFQPTYVPPANIPPPPPQTSTPTMAVSPTVVPMTPTAITSQSSVNSFSVPMPQIDTSIDPSVKPQTKIIPPSSMGIAPRMTAIKSTVGSWRSAENIRETGGDVHNLVAKFPVFIAQYADGDWDCNNFTNDGEITSGCMADLISKISEWSNKSLVGQTPVAVACDSPDLLSKPPPFIFLTGHKDFHLTEDEVTNLRKYLEIGGCIWGDSAFAGNGSRFDVAFHREMKRVLPDADKNFQVLPADHDIFTKSWFPITDIPPGMNYRADPVEIINLDGKLAIIYTPNDYSDMMTMALTVGKDAGTVDFNNNIRYQKDIPLYTPENFRIHSAYYRNFQPDAALSVYKLSMNILAHLLIRFDENLQLTP